MGRATERAVLALARNWLALLNLFWGLYVGLPVLAPLLMQAGYSRPAALIYLLYRPACHQRVERSFFLGGPQVYYSIEELAAAGVDVDAQARAIGNPAVGWKVAICERDTAIYGVLCLGGVGYALLRRRRGIWQMRVRTYLLFVLPMAIDGTLQLVGLYESPWWLRTATGACFGFGSVLLAYPILDDAFRDVRRDLEERLRP